MDSIDKAIARAADMDAQTGTWEIDGIAVEYGLVSDQWAVQTYAPSLPRGTARRAVRTHATRDQAERAAAKWRGLDAAYAAWVRDLADPDGGWR